MKCKDNDNPTNKSMFDHAVVSYDGKKEAAIRFTVEVFCCSRLLPGSWLEATYVCPTLKDALVWLVKHRCPGSVTLEHADVFMDAIPDKGWFTRNIFEVGQKIHNHAKIMREQKGFRATVVRNNSPWADDVQSKFFFDSSQALLWLAKERCHQKLTLPPSVEDDTFGEHQSQPMPISYARAVTKKPQQKTHQQ